MIEYYKGWFIQTWDDKYVVLLPNGSHWANVKSMLSAKRIISRDSKWVKVKYD